MPISGATFPIGLARDNERRLVDGENEFAVDTSDQLTNTAALYRVIVCLVPTGPDARVPLSDGDKLTLADVVIRSDSAGSPSTVSLRNEATALPWSRLPAPGSTRINGLLHALVRESLSSAPLTWDLVVSHALCVLFEVNGRMAPPPVIHLSAVRAQKRIYIDVSDIEASEALRVAWASRSDFTLREILTGDEWAVFVEFDSTPDVFGRLLSQNFASLVGACSKSFPTAVSSCHSTSLYSFMIDIERAVGSENAYHGRRLRVRYRSVYPFVQKDPFDDDGTEGDCSIFIFLLLKNFAFLNLILFCKKKKTKCLCLNRDSWHYFLHCVALA